MHNDGSELLALVPEGTYRLKYERHETGLFFGRSPKLVLWFRITDMGKYFGTLLPRYYCVQALIGRVGRNGRFKAGRSGDFVRDFARAFSVAPRRLDRIPMAPFKDALIKAEVRTVSRDHRQKALPEVIQYSVVQDLLGTER